MPSVAIHAPFPDGGSHTKRQSCRAEQLSELAGHGDEHEVGLLPPAMRSAMLVDAGELQSSLGRGASMPSAPGGQLADEKSHGDEEDLGGEVGLPADPE